MSGQSFARANPVAVIAALIALAGAATILGAWFFQYGLGLAPCPLCLEQRWPYYLMIPVAGLTALAAGRAAPRWAVAGGLAAVVLLMGWSAGLGAYHAGVEWKWWPGPQDCAGAAGFSGGAAGDLLRRMQTARVVACDEAAWRDPVLRLSLAGWNVVISLALAGLAILAIARTLRGAAQPPAAS